MAALSQPRERLVEMGLRGRRLAERELGWRHPIDRFARLYEWILGGGSPPDFVSA